VPALGAQNSACRRSWTQVQRPNDPNDPILVIDGVIVGQDAVLKVAEDDKGRAPFGVTSYSCAMCEFSHRAGQPTGYTFLSEPVVRTVNGSTPVQAGDVIVAVNEHPITTDVGANQFMYPSAGVNNLAVRRGRESLTLRVDVPEPACADSIGFIEIDASRKQWKAYPPTGRGRGRGGVDTTRVPPGGGPIGGGRARAGGPTDLRALAERSDSVRAAMQLLAGRMDVRDRFGFALSCDSTCKPASAADGTPFYRYRRPPVITVVRPNGPASMAGLRAGDVIAKVGDRSILDESGALALLQAEGQPSLSLTVLRDGKEIAVRLTAP
jgi:hypothetical protein